MRVGVSIKIAIARLARERDGDEDGNICPLVANSQRMSRVECGDDCPEAAEEERERFPVAFRLLGRTFKDFFTLPISPIGAGLE